MMLKKFYGRTVEEARKKAQKSLGETYIVVETKEAAGAQEPAWIHVLDEENGASDASKSGTYSRRDLFPKAISKLKETVNDSLQLFNFDNENAAVKGQSPAPSRPAEPRDERLMPYRTHTESGNKNYKGDSEDSNQSKIHSEIDTLSKRFDRLEALISEQMLGANVDFVSHPAFQQLLSNGVPYEMVMAWFSQLMRRGIRPFDQNSGFTQALAKLVRQTLDVAAKNEPAKFMIFTGAAGSGKSSLIMKLALNKAFMGNNSCALVSVVPQNVKNHYPSLAAFAVDHDFIHFKIGIQSQWQELQHELRSYDYVLIEMPSTEQGSTRSGFSGTMLTQAIKQSGLAEVHHVINAAMNREGMQAAAVGDSPWDYLAFTHLDAAPRKGRLLPLMDRPECRVRYTSSGLQVPGAIAKFDPPQFARQLLSNA